ncbi:MAG: tape measure protein [Oscillospiraceae bacterium]|nr:tape measure protein [Oscillospiraceae bacterium]
MSSIGTTIRLNDMMSAPIYNIIDAMDMMLSAWDTLEAETANGLDFNNSEAIRQQLAQATTAMDQLGKEQEQFNDSARKGRDVLDGLSGQILGMVSAYSLLQGAAKLVDLSDGYTQTIARLNMINDGTAETAVLYDQIAAAANRARAPIAATADTVAKLSLNAGDAFTSNTETILFAENLNKLFKIAGTEQTAISSATLQLTQALGSGVLRGEEFNAVFEAAPNIMQTVADYMDVPIGQLRSLAAEGQITADIVKSALLGATGEINDQFETIPMTWADVWTGVTNRLYYASLPLLELISLLAQNWAVIEPIALGGAATIGIYAAALLIYKGATAESAVATAIHTAFTSSWTLATFAATVQQQGFNAALLACPLTWVVVGLLAIVTAWAYFTAKANEAGETTVSVAGTICGAISTVLAVIGNVVVTAWNLLVDASVLIYNLGADIANFIGNLFVDPINAIYRLFYDLVDTVLAALQVLASALDTIFGSSLANGIQGWRDTLSGVVEDTFGTSIEFVPQLDADQWKFDRFGYEDAWNKGYELGEGLGNKLNDLGDTYNYDSLLENVGDIANSTAGISDSLEISSENLKYMKDIAERETINRFTTAEIRVEMGGVHNTVNQNTDLDGVIDYFVTGIKEASERAAEGVHS